ncbi:MAG: phospholipase D-like domain-containing protein [archaeon]
MKKLLLLLLLLTSCVPKQDLEIYFCPHDDCQREVLEELVKAKESIHFMIYSFTDEEIAAMLIEKNKKIIVEGIIERQRITSKFNVFRILNDSGVDVMPDNNKATMHNKIFIIDQKTVITGSYNPTANGKDNNNENVVIIHDENIAKKFVEEYFLIKNYPPGS